MSPVKYRRLHASCSVLGRHPALISEIGTVLTLPLTHLSSLLNRSYRERPGTYPLVLALGNSAVKRSPS